MPMTRVSPDELVEAAKENMLDGREPETRDDWASVMNFLACNVHREVADAACRLMARLYNIPLEDEEISEIVKFQLEKA